MAMERTRSCEDVGELANELGVTRRCLYKWRAKLDVVEPGEESVLPSTHEGSYRKQVHSLEAVAGGESDGSGFRQRCWQEIEARCQNKDAVWDNVTSSIATRGNPVEVRAAEHTEI